MSQVELCVSLCRNSADFDKQMSELIGAGQSLAKMSDQTLDEKAYKIAQRFISAVESGSRISVARLKPFLAAFEQLEKKICSGMSLPKPLEQLLSMASKPTGSRKIARYHPGEPVTVGSPNYVERSDWDNVLRRELTFAPDIRIALVGPPGMGKQSALAWTVAELKARGIRVAHFRGSQAICPGVEPSAKAVFEALARDAINQWLVDLPVPKAGELADAMQCAEVLARASISANPCVLVCDQVEKIGLAQALSMAPEKIARAAEADGRSEQTIAFFAVMIVARLLALIRSQGGSVPGLIFCSERQVYPTLADLWDKSSGCHLNPIITCPPFTDRESDTLIERLIEAAESGSARSATPTEEQRKLIYEVFKGHPEFTHLAVRDWSRLFPNGTTETIDEVEFKKRCRECFVQWSERGNQTIITLAMVEASAADLEQKGKMNDAVKLLQENALADRNTTERFPVYEWLKDLRVAARVRGTS
jgi:hypothetical protein